MSKQISLLPEVMNSEEIDELIHQVELFHEYAKKKRKWENMQPKGADDES